MECLVFNYENCFQTDIPLSIEPGPKIPLQVTIGEEARSFTESIHQNDTFISINLTALKVEPEEEKVIADEKIGITDMVTNLSSPDPSNHQSFKRKGIEILETKENLTELCLSNQIFHLVQEAISEAEQGYAKNFIHSDGCAKGKQTTMLGENMTMTSFNAALDDIIDLDIGIFYPKLLLNTESSTGTFLET